MESGNVGINSTEENGRSHKTVSLFKAIDKDIDNKSFIISLAASSQIFVNHLLILFPSFCITPI